MLLCSMFYLQGHSILFLELQFFEGDVVLDLFVKLFTLGIQLLLTLTVFRLNSLCNGLDFGKCLSRSIIHLIYQVYKLDY